MDGLTEPLKLIFFWVFEFSTLLPEQINKSEWQVIYISFTLNGSQPVKIVTKKTNSGISGLDTSTD